MRHLPLSVRLRLALHAASDRMVLTPELGGHTAQCEWSDLHRTVRVVALLWQRVTLVPRTVYLQTLSPLHPGYARFTVGNLHDMGRARHAATFAALSAASAPPFPGVWYGGRLTPLNVVAERYGVLL